MSDRGVRLRFRILGPCEVIDNHGPVELGGPKQRATLAILLLNANRVVSIDRLADELYSGAPPVTALKQVQRQISDLRKVLGPASPIETRSPGYTISVTAEQLDLMLFERLTGDATAALAEGAAAPAAELLRRALDLWRGPPLADLTYESFARTPIERLEEIRLAALEQHIDAELSLGHHGRIIGELQELVSQHPMREQFRAQLMLALYRAGRQADALETYRRTRQALSDGFGLEPSPALQDLERRILTQDPALGPEQRDISEVVSAVDRDRALLAAAADEDGIARVLSVAEPLGTLPSRELIVARLVADEREVAEAAASLEAMRRRLAGEARVAAFTSERPDADVVRLAGAYDVELVLVDAPSEIDSKVLPRDFAALLEGSPADVGAVVARPVDWTRGNGVFVPFGGAEHDWAALELGAWLASAAGVPLRLVGARADRAASRRDASRLLANASLAVQRFAGVTAAPVLAEASAEALVEAVAEATLVITGISPRWRSEGIGSVRRTLVRQTGPPLVLVHRGRRPSGLAPRDARTRFSWSLEV